MAWCHYLTEQKDTPDAGWLSALLCAVLKENQEIQGLLGLTGTWSFHLLHPAKAHLGPTLAEEVLDFLGAAELWMSLVGRTQVRDARGRKTGWVCPVSQCVSGCGDGREKEPMGKESPLHLSCGCLAGTQPHQSQPLLQINRAEMY